VLERPGEIGSGYGTAMSTLTDGDRGLLLVHGAAGYERAALYDLGEGDQPLTNAVSEGICSNDFGQCFLGATSAPLPKITAPSGKELSNCFAVGVGDRPDAEVGERQGVMIECETREVFPIPVPAEFLKPTLETALSFTRGIVVSMASDSSERPGLVVASQDVENGLAWYYPSIDVTEPYVLVPTDHETEDFGKTTAIVRVGDVNLIVVGAPKASQLHFFSAQGDVQPTYLGCIESEASFDFGRVLSVGAVTPDDDVPELVVSDGDAVHVLDASELLTLDAAAEPACVGLPSLPSRTIYATVTCGETGAAKGCGASNFGVSTAVGDFDGDGDGDLIVGAPGMRARDLSSAGAVQYFDLDDPNDDEPADIKFLASAESGDFLGTSLAAVRVEGRHIAAAGVPGSGRVALFYCPSFLEPGLGGARCH
jgi:hypothetical protein